MVRSMTKETTKPVEKKPAAKAEKKAPVKKAAPKNKVTKKIMYPELRQGAKGDLVDQLQMCLARDGSSVQASGVFNGGTASAVRAFQRRHGLPVNGIVGPETWAELLKIK